MFIIKKVIDGQEVIRARPPIEVCTVLMHLHPLLFTLLLCTQSRQMHIFRPITRAYHPVSDWRLAIEVQWALASFGLSLLQGYRFCEQVKNELKHHFSNYLCPFEMEKKVIVMGNGYLLLEERKLVPFTPFHGGRSLLTSPAILSLITCRVVETSTRYQTFRHICKR